MGTFEMFCSLKQIRWFRRNGGAGARLLTDSCLGSMVVGLGY